MTRIPDDPAVMVEMIFPEQANHYGTLFGGNALALMAKAAFVVAIRRARGAVVMARSDRVDFATPIRVGELLELRSEVIRVGRSSMSVSVAGVAEDLGTGARRAVLQGRFEMVAVDGAGRPRAIAEDTQRKETRA
ncbi:acyl-CoA thioesterase [Paenirhodobacter hankyongi]|uniref:Acyl-CoA thioesterase n=1 Tax=Paenirhodobacter hankyongi TaxID=2294033 RepID=A0A421BUH8_9RHOB|nr:acyl-CoA thioesterase [Sinirhodobacter hankyongi]RLL71966.1 acyl-CoA thioesterase [Sinirhodobacter hankyongi]